MGTKRVYPYLIKADWLYNYQYFDGLQEVMNGMNRRTGGTSKMDESLEDLHRHYETFEKDFLAFLPELLDYSNNKRLSL